MSDNKDKPSSDAAPDKAKVSKSEAKASAEASKSAASLASGEAARMASDRPEGDDDTSIEHDRPQGEREPKPPEPEPVVEEAKARRPERTGITPGTWMSIGVIIVAVAAVFWVWNTQSTGTTEVAGTSDMASEADGSAPVRTGPPVIDLKQQKEYLVENGLKEGVIVTETGLQLLPITLSGSSERPLATDEVKVHYAGRLIDGTGFDSSYDGPPATFPLNRVIPGWTEGLQHMAIGDKFEITIPAYLAYADKGAGDVIPPGATLIFDVELLDIIGRESASAEGDGEAEATSQ